MNIKKLVRTPLDETGESIFEAEEVYFIIENIYPKIYIECKNYEQALSICAQLGELMGLKLDLPKNKSEIIPQ